MIFFKSWDYYCFLIPSEILLKILNMQNRILFYNLIIGHNRSKTLFSEGSNFRRLPSFILMQEILWLNHLLLTSEDVFLLSSSLFIVFIFVLKTQNFVLKFCKHVPKYTQISKCLHMVCVNRVITPVAEVWDFFL
jgi:hypothetical protein